MSPSRRVIRRRRRLVALIAAGLAVALIATGAFFVASALTAINGIHRSAVIMPTGAASPGVAQNTGETNILVMGLDSRVDEDGNPYPADIYNAIHAEDASVGGYNTNVLMYLHIPAGGGPAVGISIPRDDYVTYAGNYGGVTHGKIKEAYGRELAGVLPGLLDKGMSHDQAYQQARTMARQAEINTVSQFLGGVRIDHFVEVTMAAFYRVAQAVQPIKVCLNHATADTFSGANFPAGMQEINASQAMAFVRQRRDTQYDDVFLTDLDRTRRQQAFMVSLAVKLREAGTFTNFGTLKTLIDTAKQYVALDSGFDLLSFASQAQRLAGGGISFITLPVDHFGMIDGESVNIVDMDQIQQVVHAALNPPTPTATPTPTPTPTKKSSDKKSQEKKSAAPVAPLPQLTAPNVYTNTSTPLESGTIPCVN